MFQKLMLKLFKFLLIFISLTLYSETFSQKNHKIYYNDKINNISLKEKQNPLIFIDFWATWCAPCIASMPHTQELQKHSEHVTFVYLTNDPEYKVQLFLKNKGYDFHALIDNERKTIDEFQVKSIPQSFLIGPEGEIVWKGKPTDMSLDDLQYFEEQYQNIKGDKNRFVLDQPQDNVQNRVAWKHRKQLLYRTTDFAQNIYQNNPDNQYLSGDLTYIFSFLYGIPEKQLINKLSDDYLEFKFNGNDQKKFIKAIKSFINKKYPYRLKMHTITQKIWEVKEKTDEDFMSKEIFNFGKGDAQYLKGEIAIKIDNATPEQLFKILSQQTPYTFIYIGKNKNLYDWSIIYQNKELLINQLANDLDFEIQEKEVPVKQYIFYKK